MSIEAGVLSEFIRDIQGILDPVRPKFAKGADPISIICSDKAATPLKKMLSKYSPATDLRAIEKYDSMLCGYISRVSEEYDAKERLYFLRGAGATFRAIAASDPDLLTRERSAFITENPIRPIKIDGSVRSRVAFTMIEGMVPTEHKSAFDRGASVVAMRFVA